MQTTRGLIISSFGRQYIAEANNQHYQTVSKGKKTEYVVGDEIELQIINAEQAQIMDLVTRKNLIYRSDQNRSKMIASNLDQIIIVVAVKPNFNVNFLNSCLLAAESANITPLIIINKTDLEETTEFAKNIIALYKDTLGYHIMLQSAVNGCQELLPRLINHSSLLIGQSGVGKSTITNQICPDANARTGVIAKYENSGCHTTTNATLYHIDETSDLIDCPGLQEFGLFHLSITEVAEYFPEMRDYLGDCKFNNCIHLNEPNCAILNAVKQHKVTPQRYAFYKHLCERLKTKKNY
jgi:ribosome biogenesis GTPase